MDPNTSMDASTSITESSQEWHILNLLRVCERDLFETNLQEFRKIQLTESQDGKVRLCKLINEVLRIDPQYSIILVEDLSHLFNDSNPLVQKFVLLSLVDCFNILFTHIVASNAAVEIYNRTGRFDFLSSSVTLKCLKNSNIRNDPKVAHFNHVSAHRSADQTAVTNGDMQTELPFDVDNLRVVESFADLACIRFMLHTRLLEESFGDVKYNSLGNLPLMLYNRTRFYSVNLLKLLFYELANYPNYLCSQCTQENEPCLENGSHETTVGRQASESGKAKKTPKSRNNMAKTEEGFDLFETLYRWHRESVQLLKTLLSRRTNAVSGTGKGFKNKDSQDTSNIKHQDDLLVECVLSAEVACRLICLAPEFYFDNFVDLLMPLLGTHHSGVFDGIVFRLLSDPNCSQYHQVLLDKAEEYGYTMDLRQVYRMAQTLPGRVTETHRGNMVVVDSGDTGDKDKHFQTTDQLVTNLEVEFDQKMCMYPAAQLFEFDRELVKNYKNIKSSHIGIDSNLYKHKPVEVGTLDYPMAETEVGGDKPTSKTSSGTKEIAVVNGKGRMGGLESPRKELKTVSEEVVASNQKLFVRLVGSQMVDTVASYQRFVRLEVITPRVDTFDRFARNVMNHFLISNLVDFEDRKDVVCNLFNYMAEQVIVNHGDLNVLRTNMDSERGVRGLQALFTYVNRVRDVNLFVVYLNKLSELVLYSYTSNMAMSLVTYRKIGDGGKWNEHNASNKDRYMELYERFVSLCLLHVCKFLFDVDEFGDFCVQALSKFVLNLPKVPNRIADSVVVWINSDQQGNLKLAFSLVSNLLKLSESAGRTDANTTNIDHRKYASNPAYVRRSIFMVFLTCITSTKTGVAAQFLKLISSQKGLYTNLFNYSLKSHQSLHEQFVKSLEKLKGENSDKHAEWDELYEDSLYLADRPLWQWPDKMLRMLSEVTEVPSQLTSEPRLGHGMELDAAHTHSNLGELEMYYIEEQEEDANDDVGVWIEESVALMSRPNSLSTSKFINTAVNTLLRLDTSQAQTGTEGGSQATLNSESEKHDREEEMDGSDEAAEDRNKEEVDKHRLRQRYLEPMLSCCAKNSRLVFKLSSMANEQVGNEFYAKSAQTVAKYPKELQLLIKYSDEYSAFIERVLEETRKNWCGLLFKFEERSTLEKNLMKLLLSKMSATPEYLIQMAPFLSPDQLDGLMGFLFQRYEKEKLVKVLDVIIETPKVALPQHFLCSTYNLPVATLSSANKERDYMKLQVSLLDTCIMYCTLGRFSVEAAIASLYLIVESFENINFVFGRLLCQFVQKVPLTRKVIVDVIFPKLIMKQCWQDKQLFKGVVITVCTLWNQFRDQLLRYILEMPASNVKTVLRALQSQHNVAEYLRTANVPSSLREMMEEVMASATPTNK